jgi:hypothetical protein
VAITKTARAGAQDGGPGPERGGAGVGTRQHLGSLRGTRAPGTPLVA